MKDLDLLKRLYKDYTKKYLKLIIFAFFFSVIVAGSTSAVAWLLDPAIKKIFINKDQTLIYLIPVSIIFAFTAKGVALYIARSTMINVAESAKKDIQSDMIKNLISIILISEVKMCHLIIRAQLHTCPSFPQLQFFKLKI